MTRFARDNFRSHGDHDGVLRGPSLSRGRRGRRKSRRAALGSRLLSLTGGFEQLESRALLNVAPVSASLLKDLNTAPASPNPTLSDGSKTFFTTDDGKDNQLWVIDGADAPASIATYADNPNGG
ncbi:MAG TPA: hypothetical protein PK867_16360, partial [Pirellulales bacterium]|nr:hypothetical protein [Pirellulales bacterium]